VKITKTKLMQIVKEEIESLLQEEVATTYGAASEKVEPVKKFNFGKSLGDLKKRTETAALGQGGKIGSTPGGQGLTGPKWTKKINKTVSFTGGVGAS